MLENSQDRYGAVARALHWSMALLLIALFALGWYITEITYYNPWYKISFEMHKSFGVVALVLAVMRIGWILYSPAPSLPASMGPGARMAAKAGHCTMYLMMLLIPISGYLISTADGQGISVFDLFEIPAFLPPVQGMEDLAGQAHYLLAFGTAWMVLAHMLAALKHQYVDRDGTLDKMLGRR